MIACTLDKLGVGYIYDKPFGGLKGVKNGQLRFDFRITTKRGVKFIEYNGIFHYHVINGKTTKYTLTKQQLNDFIKDEFCKYNDHKILWIPYWLTEDIIKKRIYAFLLDSN